MYNFISFPHTYSNLCKYLVYTLLLKKIKIPPDNFPLMFAKHTHTLRQADTHPQKLLAVVQNGMCPRNKVKSYSY